MCTEINLTLHHDIMLIVDIAPDFCAIRSVKQGEKFKLRDLVT